MYSEVFKCLKCETHDAHCALSGFNKFLATEEAKRARICTPRQLLEHVLEMQTQG